MTLQQKKSREFAKALAEFEWFKNEMAQYVKDGDLTQEQADRLIEDKAEILDL